MPLYGTSTWHKVDTPNSNVTVLLQMKTSLTAVKKDSISTARNPNMDGDYVILHKKQEASYINVTDLSK